MKILKLKHKGKRLKRHTLRLMASYRRFAIANNFSHLDFSKEALLECFVYESTGVGEDAKHRNGYIKGKHLKDITVKAWVEDIADGLFVPYEYITPVNAWWAKKALTGIPRKSPWFYTQGMDAVALKQAITSYGKKNEAVETR